MHCWVIREARDRRGSRRMIGLQREGEVFVLRMDYGESRFRPDKIDGWSRAGRADR